MTTLTHVPAGRRPGSKHTAVPKPDTALLVRVAVADCATQLRAQKRPEEPEPKHRHHIPGCNPDATPC